ncbi:MAG: hypothetical protein RIB03_08915 [Henriciella sp.]|uniref:hypothetical protein n=1 Tax=Henriciella sp. TaxID=1968823 RepID=UPI0032ED90C5
MTALLALLTRAGIRTGLESERFWTVSGPLAPWLRREALGMVQLAEGLVRRLIAILALSMRPYRPVASQRPGSRPQGLARSSEPDPSRGEAERGSRLNRTPAFKLFEYVPRLGAGILDVDTPEGRAILIRRLSQPKGPPRPYRAASLLRRIAALEGVLKHRRRAAHRLNRWLAKKAHGAARKLHNLRGGAPPGLLRLHTAEGSWAGEFAREVYRLAWARAGPDLFRPATIHPSDPPRKHGRGPKIVPVEIRPLRPWHLRWE